MSETSRARTHHIPPLNRNGMMLVNVAPDHDVTGANRTRPILPGPSMPAEHPMACTIASLAGAESACQPRDVGQCAAQADSLGDPTDDVAGVHRQPFARRCDPLENALGENTVRMKQAAATLCGAESDWQRGDAGGFHDSGVPETAPANPYHGFNNGDSGH